MTPLKIKMTITGAYFVLSSVPKSSLYHLLPYTYHIIISNDVNWSRVKEVFFFEIRKKVGDLNSGILGYCHENTYSLSALNQAKSLFSFDSAKFINATIFREFSRTISCDRRLQ